MGSWKMTSWRRIVRIEVRLFKIIEIQCLCFSCYAFPYFPDLDSDPEWEITADSDEQVYFDITYQFLKYERKKS